jgi:hypothetical protein
MFPNSRAPNPHPAIQTIGVTLPLVLPKHRGGPAMNYDFTAILAAMITVAMLVMIYALVISERGSQ